MCRTPNPPDFEAAVREHLAPHREQFNYEQMLLTFLSNDRFHQWAALVSRYRPLEGARVLSSGCGFGGSLVAYRDAGAKLAVGVEVDGDYVRFSALRTAPLAASGVVHYDGVRLPFRSGVFDVIESMDVIEHTADDEAYLAELRRVLAPGGVVLLVTPNRLWPVEQHLGIPGPPWLPVRVADALFGALARLPLSEDRRFRFRALRGMRTKNMSMRRLLRLAGGLGFRAHVLTPGNSGASWPLPPRPPWMDRMAGHRWLTVLAPVPTLAVLLIDPREPSREHA